MNVILNIYLFWGTLQDIKRKAISNNFIKVGIVIAIGNLLRELCYQNFSIRNRIWSMVPGIIFLIIARISKEKIGYGDGIVFVILGTCMEAFEVMNLWQISILLNTICSLFMVAIKKWHLHSQVAFLPFIWIVHTCRMCFQVLS